MEPKEEQDSDAQSEAPTVDPFFIRKQSLDAGEKVEMMEEVNSLKKTFRAVNEMWETMSKVFSQREEVSIARKQAHLKQAKEKQADSFSVTPGRTSKAPTIDDICLDEDTAKRYYNMWSDDLKKNIEQQRRKTRQGVEKWFEYLHQFDGMEERHKPSNGTQSWDSIWYVFVIILCAVHTILSFGPEDEKKCEGDPLACFPEKVLDVLVGVYNFYLGFHNITIDLTEKAGIALEKINSTV